jgi:hypothetical protein
VAISHLMYGLSFTSTFNKEADWNSDTVKTMLCTSTYTPNQDTHQYKSSVTNEITGTGYTATGTTLTTPAVAYNTGTNVWSFDADDASWTTATITARYAVTYDSTPSTDATRPLLSYVDFGADQSVTGATFTVQWNASGIINITVS